MHRLSSGPCPKSTLVFFLNITASVSLVSLSTRSRRDGACQEIHDEEYGEWLTKEEKFHLDNAKAGVQI